MTTSSDERFGFNQTPEGTPEARERVGRVASAVADGCAIALTSPGAQVLAESLDAAFAREFRPFAYEGAGMGLALLESTHEGKEEALFSFVNGPGVPYHSGVFIGIGLALARLGQNPLPMLGRFEQPLRWRILDGFGFYLGMTEQHYAQGSAAPSDLVGYAQRVFDQGLGRSFWFSHGCDADKIKATIDVFSASRHADLWRGVGFGCTMAGGAGESQVRALKAAAAEYQAYLAQAAAFAALARQESGNPTAWTELGCEVLAGMSASESALLAKNAGTDLTGIQDKEEISAYEVWQQRVLAHFSYPARA